MRNSKFHWGSTRPTVLCWQNMHPNTWDWKISICDRKYNFIHGGISSQPCWFSVVEHLSWPQHPQTYPFGKIECCLKPIGWIIKISMHSKSSANPWTPKLMEKWGVSSPDNMGYDPLIWWIPRVVLFKCVWNWWNLNGITFNQNSNIPEIKDIWSDTWWFPDQ